MSDFERRLAELENMHRAMVRDGENRRRMMAKSFAAGRYAGNTRRRPDFGKPGVQPANIDLTAAETCLRRLDQRGLLTKSQSAEAWRRLTNLRPVETLLLK